MAENSPDVYFAQNLLIIFQQIAVFKAEIPLRSWIDDTFVEH